MRKGFFIVFEGGEAAGKSTQIKRLVRWLKAEGVRFEVTRQPGGCGIGKGIRRLLLDPVHAPVAPRAELMLYEADRAQHVDTIILPALESGKVVISDRYADSSTVYQGIVRGLGKRWTEQLNAFATGGLKPDLVVLLDVPADEARLRLRKRGKLDRIEREKAAFHRKVRAGFLRVARENPGRFAVVDGRESVDEVGRRIQAALAPRLRRKGIL